jgi:hypothetical protein
LLAKPYFISGEVTARAIVDQFGFGKVGLFLSIKVQEFGVDIVKPLQTYSFKLELSTGVVVEEKKQELNKNTEDKKIIYFFI